MHILILDNVFVVRDNFKAIIENCDCIPVVFDSIADTKAYIIGTPDQRGPLDICYIDYHLGHGENGLSLIGGFKKVRPDVHFVMTTSRTVTRAFVEEVVNLGVGFFDKSGDSLHRLEADIAQRVRILREEQARHSRSLSSIKRALEQGEGWFSFLASVRGTKVPNFRITGCNLLAGGYLLSRFKQVQWVHRGEKKTIGEETEVSADIEFKASTELGLGLKASQSAEFFATKFGGEIKNTIRTAVEVRQSTKHVQKLKTDASLEITASEEEQGVQKKEIYLGMVHEKWCVDAEFSCDCCNRTERVALYVYRPIGPVGAMVCYGVDNRIISDGRNLYRLVEPIF